MFAASKSGQVTGSTPPPPPSSDPQFNYVTALLTGDGTNGAQNNTFIDSSANNFTITRAGNTTQGSVSPYGGNWSNYFDGSGDYLSVASNAAFALPGDFTYECWFNSDNTGITTLFAEVPTSNGFQFYYNGSQIFVSAYGVTSLLQYTYTIPQGVWTHIALVRSGTGTGNLKLYINGVSVTSATTTQSFAQGDFRVGGTSYYFKGYISNVRLVKGTAVYTANFTPSTTPLTAITNTSLLTCQSNRFVDNSTNNFAITVNGNTRIEVYSPFEPVAPYSTSTNGGSMSFDGIGDYLLTPANSAITAFGTGDFTIETWVYTTAFPHATGMFLFDARTSGNPNNWCLYLASGDSLVFLYNGAYVTITSTTFYQNRWYHIAYSRSGTSGKLFVNGVVVTSPTDTNNYNQTTVCTVGARYTQDYILQGYMSNARIVKGTAVYTSAFVPPSAPVTAITNTSLLLNGTNGGIFDNAMMSNYETVGNAQISTSVVKYGTGSMYFDGSGDYLFSPTSNANNLSKFLTANFTVECWIYPTTTSGDRTIICAAYSWGAGANYEIELRSGLLFVQLGNGVTMTSGTTSISANTWTHIALVRSSTTSTTFYVNGVSVATYTGNWTADEDCPLTIGCFNINGGGLSNYWLGYIDDLRISKYARYVANFTPPTQAFPTY